MSLYTSSSSHASAVSTANASATNSGIGFSGLLTIAFIVLKLTKVITWSWVWVLSPIWIGILLAIIAVGCFIAALLLTHKS